MQDGLLTAISVENDLYVISSLLTSSLAAMSAIYSIVRRRI